MQQELDTIASYYQLKHTIRWAHNRSEDETESVAEHVYGLHLLIDYFYPLVSLDTKLNIERIRHLATWHDMAEAFVGDMTTRTKTKDHEIKEKEAEDMIIKNGPPHLRKMLEQVYREYDARETSEAKFVKALDKIEPQFHLYFLSLKEKDFPKFFKLGWDADTYRKHRSTYVNEFLIIKRFDDILYEKIKATNFHHQ